MRNIAKPFCVNRLVNKFFFIGMLGIKNPVVYTGFLFWWVIKFKNRTAYRCSDK